MGERAWPLKKSRFFNFFFICSQYKMKHILFKFFLLGVVISMVTEIQINFSFSLMALVAGPLKKKTRFFAAFFTPSTKIIRYFSVIKKSVNKTYLK